MPTTMTRTAPPAALSFEARCALTDVEMTARLEAAGLTFDVRTAGIETAPVVPLDVPPVPVPDRSPVTEVLVEAARILTVRGHARGRMVDEAGARCVVGAVQEAARAVGGPDPQGATDAALSAILRLLEQRFGTDVTVPAWSDRTDTDVVVRVILAAAS